MGGMRHLANLAEWMPSGGYLARMGRFPSGAEGDELAWSDELIQVVTVYGLLLTIGFGVALWFAFWLPRQTTSWQRGVKAIYRRPWRVSDAGGILLLLFSLFFFAWAVLTLMIRFGPDPTDTDEGVRRMVIGQSLALHGSILVIVVLWSIRSKLSWTRAMGAAQMGWLKGAGTGVLAYLSALPLLFLGAVMYHLFLKAVGYEADIQDAVRLFAELERDWLYFYFIFMAVFLAPLAEEILFRGVLFPAFARPLGWKASMLVTSALFAFMHMHVGSFVPLMILSIVLTLSYVYTRTVWTPIWVHILFNGLNLWAVAHAGIGG